MFLIDQKKRNSRRLCVKAIKTHALNKARTAGAAIESLIELGLNSGEDIY